MIVRSATPKDAPAMAEVLNEIIKIGGTTAWMSHFDAAQICETFIEKPLALSCFVAIKFDRILGFQALEWCDPDWDGPDPLPADWALISTFVSAEARGLGLGRSLFDMTLVAARNAKVSVMDATIRADNVSGLGYYSHIGFTDFSVVADIALDDGTKVDRIRKRFDL